MTDKGLKKNAIGFVDGLVIDVPDRVVLLLHEPRRPGLRHYYRRELSKSAKNLLFIGVGPLIGAVILGYLFVRAITEYSQTDQSYTGSQLFGVAMPVVLGLGLLVLGFVLMLIWRAMGHEDFFGRRREIVHPEVAAGRRMGVAAVPEEAV